MAVHSKVDDATELPNIAERAIKYEQLLSLAENVEQLCHGGHLMDQSLMKLSPAGQKVSNPHQGKPLNYGSWDGVEGNDAPFFAEINMYDVVELVLKPLTKGPGNKECFPSGCSYVEIFATRSQPAEYFVSHYFGQAFAVFLSALSTYVRRQTSPNETCLWISSFATRHWCKENNLSPNIDMLPFMSALQCQSMKGTILITSSDCIAMQRTWCLFEISKSIQKRGHRLDIVLGAAGNNPTPILCTNGGSSSSLELVGSSTWERLLNVNVEQAAATKFADKHFLTSQIPGPRDFNLAICQRLGQHALMVMASQGDAHGLEKVLTFRVDVNFVDQGSFSKDGTALHRAVSSSRLEVVRLLLQNKADVNDQRNTSRATPLHWAQSKQISQLLLEAGANPALEDINGQPAQSPGFVGSELAVAEAPVEEVAWKPPSATEQRALEENAGDQNAWHYDDHYLLSLLGAGGASVPSLDEMNAFDNSVSIRWKSAAAPAGKSHNVDVD